MKKLNHRLFFFVGFTSLLTSILLVWFKLNHFLYAGLDGNLFQFTIDTYLHHTQPFSLDAINIFQGLGSPLIQMNAWLNPGYLVFLISNPEIARISSAAIFLSVYCFSTYYLSRTFGLSTLSAIIACQLAVIAFPPFQYNLGLGIQFVLNPGVSYHIALITLILCIVIRTSSYSARKVLINACSIAAIYSYSIYCDPLWTVVISTAFVIPFIISLFASGGPYAFWVRTLTLFISGFLLYCLGVFHFAFSIAGFTARQYFQPEVFGEVQTGKFVSILFQSQKVGLYYWFLLCGWIFGLIFTIGRQRLLATICLIYMLFIFSMGAAYLFLQINWTFPVPMYFEQSVYHLYIVGAVGGWVSLLSYYKHLALQLQSYVVSKLNLKSIYFWMTSIIKGICPSITSIRRYLKVKLVFNWISILVIPAGIFYFSLNLPNSWYEIYREKPPINTGLIPFIRQEVGLDSGQPFRGAITMPLPKLTPTYAPYEQMRILYTLWINKIPTLEIYSQMVPPPYFYFISRLLMSRSDPIGRNGLAITTLNLPALQILGTRFILSRENINERNTSLRKTSMDEQGNNWHLYELSNPNTGNYYSINTYYSLDARESIELMRQNNFNFEKDAIVTERINTTLSPTKKTGFAFQDGGIRIWAKSDGYSLMILPVQYSRCWEFSNEIEAEIKRVNLTLTGILFYKNIETTLRRKPDFFSSQCRIEDIRDLTLLKFKPEATRPYLGQHPYAIKSFDNMYPQLIEVLGELLPQ